MSQHIRVGVIMGGISIENDVSLNSGRTICDHLDTRIYNVIPLFQNGDGKLYILPWRFLHRGKIADFAHRLADEAEHIRWDDLAHHIDFLYSALHGRYGEDGSLQGMCEVLGIPYLGSGILASSRMIDKWHQQELLQAIDVPHPRTLRITPEYIDQYQNDSSHLESLLADAGITLPVIVKPRFEGSSLGVSKAYTRHDVIQALHDAAYINAQAQDAIIQECIHGTEVCQIALADNDPSHVTALPPTEVVHEAETDIFDYSQKYMPGRAHKYTPPRMQDDHIQRIQSIAHHIVTTYELRTFVRIDFICSQHGTPYVIDINTFPGTAPSSFPFVQAAEIGLSHTDVINRCIAVELRSRGMHSKIDEKRQDMQHHDDRLRIAVLLGGSCHEREVSLESGRNACYKLSPNTYRVTPVFMDKQHRLYSITQRQLVRNTTEEIEHVVKEDSRIFWNDLPDMFDFVFLGLHGGIGENGAVQGALDMLHIPYNGSPAKTSALCMNKYKVHHHLHRHGFHVPNYQFVSREAWNADMISLNTTFPVIVKPHDDGSSVNVIKADTTEEAYHALRHIFADDNTGALIEEVIHGMELTVGVIGNETAFAFPPSYAVAQSDILSMEEKFLPGAGENQTPAPLTESELHYIRTEVERAYQALGCMGYARIDCFYQNAEQSPTGESRVVFLEPNTLPALTPATCIFHQAAEVGLKPMEFFDTLVELGRLRHKQDLATLRTLESNIRKQSAI